MHFKLVHLTSVINHTSHGLNMVEKLNVTHYIGLLS